MTDAARLTLLAGLMFVAGCATAPVAQTPAQKRITDAFNACRHFAPGARLRYVDPNGAWQADGAVGPDILLITNCMREKTGGSIYIK